ncbi:MAG: plasmid maintenance system antidote protein [Stygiobacter sp.]|nr:MAG: plasmid maintenance system antidote protein [Stygiobacter sp.]KAF0215208.1 MAG: plasmid maintenance system antidote [Ignavibacteria bacterium]
MSSKTKIEPVHPGEILLTEFLEPMNISQLQLSHDIGVSIQTINQLCLRKRAITAGSSLLLGKYFGVTESFWLNLQNRYDIEVAKDIYDERLRKIKTKRLKQNLT